MSKLRERFIEDMQLAGLAKSTIKRYVRVVARLSKHYKISPATIQEEQLREYLLYIINDLNASESSVRITLAGLHRFFETTLGRKWPVLDLARPRNRFILREALSLRETKALLGQIRQRRNGTILKVIYSCGLRISQALRIRVEDIDAERMLLYVRQDKGGKDRNVPLPKRTLQVLREYWIAERPERPFLFPSPKNSGKPLSCGPVRQTLNAAAAELQLKKTVTPHILRHSYATHLLEAGVDVNTIKLILGHSSIRTTEIYLHMSPQILSGVQSTLDRIMADL